MSATRILTASALGVAAAITPLGAGAASAGSTPGCVNADMVAHYRYSNSGAGHRYGKIVLRNVSHHACVIGGWIGLSYVGHGNGTQIGAAATRTGGPAYAYVVQPGQRLRAWVDETVAQNYPASICRPRHVDGFRVYIPNSFLAQYIVHPTTGCANAHVKLLQVKPLVR